MGGRGGAHLEGTALSESKSNQSTKACSSACSLASVASMAFCSSSVKLTCAPRRFWLWEPLDGRQGWPPHRASGLSIHDLVPKYPLLRESDFKVVSTQIGAVGGRGGSDGHAGNPELSRRFQFLQSDRRPPVFQIRSMHQRRLMNGSIKS
jgi:hypothetical protein